MHSIALRNLEERGLTLTNADKDAWQLFNSRPPKSLDTGSLEERYSLAASAHSFVAPGYFIVVEEYCTGCTVSNIARYLTADEIAFLAIEYETYRHPGND